MINTPESESVLDVLRANETEAYHFLQYFLGVQDAEGEDLFINPQRHPLWVEHYRKHGQHIAEDRSRHDLEMVGRWADIAAERGRLVRWYSSVHPIDPPF